MKNLPNLKFLCFPDFPEETMLSISIEQFLNFYFEYDTC